VRSAADPSADLPRAIFFFRAYFILSQPTDFFDDGLMVELDFLAFCKLPFLPPAPFHQGETADFPGLPLLVLFERNADSPPLKR